MAQSIRNILFLALAAFQCILSEAEEAIEVDFSHGIWDGVSLYVPTSRALIQEKLDDWYNRNSRAGGGRRLYLPEGRVFRGLDLDTHVIYLDFGDESFEEFERSEAADLDSDLNTTNSLFTIVIPFLAATPDGPPSYSLALAILHDKHQGVFPESSAVFRLLPVDKITLDRSRLDLGILLVNGSDEIRITCHRHFPCETPTPVVRDEFFASHVRQYTIPFDGLHGLEFCDSYPRQNDYCDALTGFRDAAYQYSPDVCQSWYDTTGNIRDCVVTCDDLHISDGFLDYIPIAAGEGVPALYPARYTYDYGLIFKYPCLP